MGWLGIDIEPTLHYTASYDSPVLGGPSHMYDIITSGFMMIVWAGLFFIITVVILFLIAVKRISKSKLLFLNISYGNEGDLVMIIDGFLIHGNYKDLTMVVHGRILVRNNRKIRGHTRLV